MDGMNIHAIKYEEGGIAIWLSPLNEDDFGEVIAEYRVYLKECSEFGDDEMILEDWAKKNGYKIIAADVGWHDVYHL